MYFEQFKRNPQTRVFTGSVAPRTTQTPIATMQNTPHCDQLNPCCVSDRLHIVNPHLIVIRALIRIRPVHVRLGCARLEYAFYHFNTTLICSVLPSTGLLWFATLLYFPLHCPNEWTV